VSGFDQVARTIVQAVQRHRSWWFAAAALLFVGGCIVSVQQLHLNLVDLHVGPATAILIVLGPITLVHGAAALHLLALGSGVSLKFSGAFRSNCAAQFAEILPLPGGAIVRIGALVAAGVPARRGAALVLMSALLWGFVAGTLASLALFKLSGDRQFLVAGIAGVIVVGLVVARMVKLVGIGIAGALLALRLTGCILLAARLMLSFAAIGRPEPATTAFVLGLATVAGSAAGIVPAGVGLSELVGAALATTVNVDPFAAFLAIGLDRLLGLISNGTVLMGVEHRATGFRHRGQ
jgi:hypothetical protein